MSEAEHRSRPRRTYLHISLSAFLLAAVIAVFGLVEIPHTLESALLAGLSSLCLLPFLFAWLRGRFDIFEPVYYVSLVHLVYYGIVVAIHMREDSFVMLGIDYRAEVPRMLALTILSVLAFYVGYFWLKDNQGLRDRHVVRDDEVGSPLQENEKRFLHRAALFMFLVFAFLLALWIVVGRIPLSALSVFGEAGYGDWWETAGGPRIGYLYAVRYSLPACLLLILGSRSQKQWPVWYLFLMLAVLVFLAGQGGRSRLLLLAQGAWAFYYLERQRRPASWQVLPFVLLVFFVIVGAVGFYRVEGRTITNALPSAADSWDVFVESSSVATVTAARLHWMEGFAWGKSLLKVFVQWIPSAIWPDKYAFLAAEPRFARYFPTGSASTLWVTFYADFGIIGILVGMFVVALLSWRVYRRYLQRPLSLFGQVNLALLGPFLLIVLGRSDISQTLYSCLLVFGPVFILQWLLRVYRRTFGELTESGSRTVRAWRRIP